jgi:hypothetical protein
MGAGLAGRDPPAHPIVPSGASKRTYPVQEGIDLVKTNFQFRKRQLELEKKRKKEEKLRRKQEEKNTSTEPGEEAAVEAGAEDAELAPEEAGSAEPGPAGGQDARSTD